MFNYLKIVFKTHSLSNVFIHYRFLVLCPMVKVNNFMNKHIYIHNLAELMFAERESFSLEYKGENNVSGSFRQADVDL